MVIRHLTKYRKALRVHHPERKRAFYGYTVSSGFTVVAFMALSGPFFPYVLITGIFIALVCGVFIVVPVYALLEHLGQLRPWWAALLGAALMSWSTSLSMICFGALAGLVGWVVAYGFRLRPEAVAGKQR